MQITHVEEKNRQHIMLDIETLGVQSYAVILSIGAVKFDITTGIFSDTLYTTICLQSCIDIGLHIEANTLQWWLQQPTEVFAEALKGDYTITKALHEFSQWYTPRTPIWGNAASFDLGLLANAYHKAGIPQPWSYYDERCLRTLAHLAPHLRSTNGGIKHHPVSDCKYQIQYCYQIYNLLVTKNPNLQPISHHY